MQNKHLLSLCHTLCLTCWFKPVVKFLYWVILNNDITLKSVTVLWILSWLLPLWPPFLCTISDFQSQTLHDAGFTVWRSAVRCLLIVLLLEKGKGGFGGAIGGWRMGGDIRGTPADTSGCSSGCTMRREKRERVGRVVSFWLHCTAWSVCTTDSPRLMDKAVYRT